MSQYWYYEVGQEDDKTLHDVLYDYQELIESYEIKLKMAIDLQRKSEPGSHDHQFFSDIISKTIKSIEGFKYKRDLVTQTQL